MSLMFNYDRGQNRVFQKSASVRSRIHVAQHSNRGVSQKLYDTLSPAKQQHLDQAFLTEGIFDIVGNQLTTGNYGTLGYDFGNNLQFTTIQDKLSGNSSNEFSIFSRGGQRTRKVTETYDKNGKMVVLHTVDYLGFVEYRNTYMGNDLSYDGATVTANGNVITPMESYRSLRILEGHRQVAQSSYFVYYLGQAVSEFSTCWYLGNNIDSCQLLLNDIAAGVAYTGNSPYGEKAEVKGDSNTWHYQYSGQETDDNKSVYYGYRNYLPENGRWNQSDPAGFVNGLNKYAFVANNPLTYRDEKGLMLMELLLGALLLPFSSVGGIKEGDEITIDQMMEVSSNIFIPEFHTFGFTYLATKRIFESNKNRKHYIYQENTNPSGNSLLDYIKGSYNKKEANEMIKTMSKYSYKEFKDYYKKNYGVQYYHRGQYARNVIKLQVELSPYKKSVKFRYVGLDNHKNTRKTIINRINSKKNVKRLFNIGASHVMFKDNKGISMGYKEYYHSWKDSESSFNLLYNLTEGGYDISMLLVDPKGLDESNYEHAEYKGQFAAEWTEYWETNTEMSYFYYLKNMLFGGPDISKSKFRVRSKLNYTTNMFNHDYLPIAYQFNLDTNLLNDAHNWNKVKVLRYGKGKPTIFQMNAIEYSKRYVDKKQNNLPNHRQILQVNEEVAPFSGNGQKSLPSVLDLRSFSKNYPGGRYIYGVPYRNREDYFRFGLNPTESSWRSGRVIPRPPGKSETTSQSNLNRMLKMSAPKRKGKL